MSQGIKQDGRGMPNPYSRRERVARLAWEVIRPLFFRPMPRMFNGWHRMVLRLFGAKVGRGVRIYASAHVYLPWMVTIEDNCVLGDGVLIYSLGKVRIGRHTVLSQRAHICAGTHDYKDPGMPLLRPPISIGEGCWICTEAFVGPGVEIGDGAVVGARSVVTRSLPAGMVCAGNPCRPIKPREMRAAKEPG